MGLKKVKDRYLEARGATWPQILATNPKDLLTPVPEAKSYLTPFDPV